MEKIVFVFRRKPGTTRDAFFSHYLDVHAPLGLRVVDNLVGYTVNLLITPAEFEAVTEVWTPKAASFAGGGATGEGAAAIAKDHVSFMGPQDAYAVEEKILRDGPLTSPLGALTPGEKLVSFLDKGEQLPEPDPSAYRVVDNIVLRAIYLKDRPVDAALGPSSDLAIIRTSWYAPDRNPALSPKTFALREYRNRTF